MSTLKNKVRHLFLCFLSCISPKLNVQYRYRRMFGKKLDLVHPTLFNEKILWLEQNRYEHDPLVAQCSDKQRVREYVQNCGCGEILVDKIGDWEKADEIPWEALPQQFVLKWNFGAGFNIICTNKNALDREQTIRQMNRWGRAKYWLWYAEMHYKAVPKRIVCETYLNALDSSNGENAGSERPEDYKFYCFNGRPIYILVCLNRKGMLADYIFMDTDWNLQPFSSYAIKNADNIHLKRPEMLDEALRYAEKLAAPFPFVRVDLYMLKDKIYFGETTFTPCGGMDDDLFDGNQVMGELLNISHS